MEQKFEITRSELIELFSEWNKDCIENADDYNPISDTIECAELQADKFISLLTSKHS